MNIHNTRVKSSNYFPLFFQLLMQRQNVCVLWWTGYLSKRCIPTSCPVTTEISSNTPTTLGFSDSLQIMDGWIIAVCVKTWMHTQNIFTHPRSCSSLWRKMVAGKHIKQFETNISFHIFSLHMSWSWNTGQQWTPKSDTQTPVELVCTVIGREI